MSAAGQRKYVAVTTRTGTARRLPVSAIMLTTHTPISTGKAHTSPFKTKAHTVPLRHRMSRTGPPDDRYRYSLYLYIVYIIVYIP